MCRAIGLDVPRQAPNLEKHEDLAADHGNEIDHIDPVQKVGHALFGASPKPSDNQTNNTT